MNNQGYVWDDEFASGLGHYPPDSLPDVEIAPDYADSEVEPDYDADSASLPAETVGTLRRRNFVIAENIETDREEKSNILPSKSEHRIAPLHMRSEPPPRVIVPDSRMPGGASSRPCQPETDEGRRSLANKQTNCMGSHMKNRADFSPGKQENFPNEGNGR
ncbi:hypothetical protein CAPTEDRAFT_190702 [Capitella teleta]|uniref:Uncharacterized protein n=1 Tax=Capitella teleta TaxID=283909 RepID=R7TS31_CAPTE|nr:hypothetical protein CAPTEDRAFT_190702 [Capitella teleta]|eukprot:ELT96459.1 hypothetical protein CAPTEDRAFT_190702 [Capitella teleta]